MNLVFSRRPEMKFMQSLRPSSFCAAALLAAAILCLSPAPASAQLVADGATNTLFGDPGGEQDIGTNIVGSVIVGTNGSFTSLILTDNFTLTNSGDSYIGYNLGANSNRVTVDSSLWDNPGYNITVGRNGSWNTLLITNYGDVFNLAGYIGVGSDSNQVTVTGFGSSWHSSAEIKIGNLGSFNNLLIVNEGRVENTDAFIGYGSGIDPAVGKYNQVTVTGANSLWANTGELHVGEYGQLNSLLISNGGQVENSQGYIGRFSDNNHVSVTGSGSRWTNSGLLTLGGNANTLLINSGGTVTSSGGTVDGFNNQVTVSGLNSAWTNSGPLTLVGGENTLLITNGGTVANSDGTFDSDNNQVTVSGLNSVWNNSGALAVGNYYSFNTLLINGGGRVEANSQSIIGNQGNFNQVTVADGGSVWTNGGDLTVGYYGSDNTLLITNGGRVEVNSQSSTGNPGDNNHVIVTGFGSVWSNGVAVLLGNSGADNTLLVTASGAVQSPLVTIGNSINLTSGSLLTVSDGTLTATGGGGTGVLDVPYGELVFNGGTITADRLPKRGSPVL